MNAPAQEAGITVAVRSRFMGNAVPDSGNGRQENRSISRAVIVPDNSPDRIPSPENRTAAIPEMNDDRYRQARARGFVMEPGSSAALAAAQETRRSRISPPAQKIWERRQEIHMGLVFVCIKSSRFLFHSMHTNPGI